MGLAMTELFVRRYAKPTPDVIPSEAKESPGGILRFAETSRRAPVPVFGAFVIAPAYQEIATGLRPSQ